VYLSASEFENYLPRIVAEWKVKENGERIGIRRRGECVSVVFYHVVFHVRLNFLL